MHRIRENNPKAGLMMNENAVYYIIIFVFGAVIGSFLNVCIFRLPAGMKITGRSHCLKCNARIKWYDLIPIISYIVLRGHCRNCKSKISVQYPLIEALNGILYVFVFYVRGFNSLYDCLISCSYCFVISALLVISVIDSRTNTIPFGINIFIAVMGLLSTVITFFKSGNNINVIIDHLSGLFSVSLLLLVIYLVTRGKGIGGGDIKLMAAAGLVLGLGQNIVAFLIGCILATIIHPIRMKVQHLDSMLAFGPYLSVGIVLSMLFGRQIVDWYLAAFWK